MSATPPVIITKKNITIFIGGKQHQINRESHPNAEAILTAFRERRYEDIEALVNVSKAVSDYLGGSDIKIVGGGVTYKGRPLHNVVTDRILQMMREGFDYEPMAVFLSNLMQNPSNVAVSELYLFLEHCSNPITSDGHFLAYKRIRNDWKDIYTGTMDNSVGQVLEMSRNEVDDRRNNTCSAGLHFCSESYLQFYGSHDSSSDRVVIVKVNPRDVVSIPSDYNNAKGRACRYEVVGEVDRSNLDFYKTAVHDFPTKDDLDGLDDFEVSAKAADVQAATAQLGGQVDGVDNETGNYDAAVIEAAKNAKGRYAKGRILGLINASDCVHEDRKTGKLLNTGIAHPRGTFAVFSHDNKRLRAKLDSQIAEILSSSKNSATPSVVAEPKQAATSPEPHDNDGVTARVKRVMAEQLGVSESEIDMGTRVIEDLGADSLDVVELSLAIEDEFAFDASDEEIEKVRTVGDIVVLVQEKLAGSRYYLVGFKTDSDPVSRQTTDRDWWHSLNHCIINSNATEQDFVDFVDEACEFKVVALISAKNGAIVAQTKGEAGAGKPNQAVVPLPWDKFSAIYGFKGKDPNQLIINGVIQMVDGKFIKL